MRAVHSGRIRIAMINAKLDDVGPTGRQVEELSKVPADHTVEACVHTLEHIRTHGKSDAIAREGLLDYCKIMKIPFGKRMPNGSSKSGVQRALRRSKADRVNAPSSVLSPDESDWSLSPREEQIILDLDPSSSESTDTADQQQRVSQHVATLRKVASTRTLTDYDAHQLEALLALVMRKDEATGRSLAILALEMLRNLVMREL